MISLKETTISDVPEILNFTKEFEDYLNSLGSTTPVVYELTQDSLEKYCFGETKLFSSLFVTLQDKNIGFLNFYNGFLPETNSKIAFVSDLYIKDEYRGHIFELKDSIFNYFKDMDIKEIHWTTWKDNPRAKALYQSMGAKNYEKETGEIVLFSPL